MFIVSRGNMNTLFSLLLVFVLAFMPAHAQNTQNEKAELARKVELLRLGGFSKTTPQEHQKFYEDFCRAFAERYTAATPAAKVQKGWVVILTYAVEDVIRVPWVFGPADKHGQLEPVSVRGAIMAKEDPVTLGVKSANELIRILSAPVVPPRRKE